LFETALAAPTEPDHLQAAMHPMLRFTAAFLSFSLGGCVSGQTGSPECVGATSCVCDTLYSGGALLRLHAESSEHGRLVAVVDQVVGSLYGPTDIRAGDRIGGELTVQRPCDPQAMLELEGVDLFVLFYPGGAGGYPACDSQSDEVCAERRAEALLSGGYRFVIPWEDELNFGAEHLLPSSEVETLFSPESCWEHFPLGPTPPCNDTKTSCSVSQPSPPSNGWAWGGVAVSLAFVGRSRRWRRST
jgi:MYXO-CTERM domain-containing protein